VPLSSRRRKNRAVRSRRVLSQNVEFVIVGLLIATRSAVVERAASVRRLVGS